MSFFGTTFSFNGHSCEEYGLMMYDLNSAEQETSSYAKISLQEDRIPLRYKPLHYGIKMEDPLEFTIVCSVNEQRAMKKEPLDRWDMQRIAQWLTGHQQYKWLHIDQPDMEDVRYRCVITQLKMIEIFHEKQGIEFTVTCDSPYAYTLPHEYFYSVVDSSTVALNNMSSINGFYYPKIEIANATSASITNTTDGGRVFSLSSIPSGATISIDCENQVITSSDGTNMYPYFNFQFLRLATGTNNLAISGSGTYKIICEFPVNVGG